MRKSAIMIAVAMLSTTGFAAQLKNTGKIESLGSLFQAQQSNLLKKHEERVTTVYAGEDISRQPTLTTHYLTA